MKKSTLNKIKLLSLCCLLAMISCKAKKLLVVKAAPATSVAPTTVRNPLDAIRAGQTGFNTFSAKARTKLSINGSSNDVTLNIRIKSDQKIWVSITAIAGIEVARALITPDSIMIINRLQSVYVRKPFGFIYTFTGRQINYKTVESLLTGNAIAELLNKNADLQTTAGVITLTGNLQSMLYKLIINPAMKVTQTNLNDQNAGQSLMVSNDSFMQFNNKVVPTQIDITSVVKDKKLQVNLHYVKVDFDQPLEFPFSIPARYTPAN